VSFNGSDIGWSFGISVVAAIFALAGGSLLIVDISRTPATI